MEFRIAIAQTCHPEDGDVVALVERYTAEARAMKVEMVVFPESLMSRYEAELGDFLAQSQPLDGPFTKAVDAIAAKHGIWIVYTMNELFEPIDTPFGKLGMAICYDLRFPEVSRAAALAGCDIMVYPAAWVDGPGKALQWQTLLSARAIENEMFVIGACRADDGYVGQSLAVGPDGVVHARGGEDEALLVARFDTADLDRVRTSIPVFDHRRPELY